jgi:hypothetical protein
MIFRHLHRHCRLRKMFIKANNKTSTWTIKFSLKGQCHKIFYPWFFLIDQPLLIHRLMPFCIWLHICRDNLLKNHQNQILRSQWDCGIRLFFQSLPKIFLFPNNSICMWCLPTVFICFCYGFPLKGMRVYNRFCKDACDFIRFLQSHWDCGTRSRSLIETVG